MIRFTHRSSNRIGDASFSLLETGLKQMFIPVFFLHCLVFLSAISAATERFEVQSVFDLAESDWSEFEAIAEPVHYPRESLLRLLNRMGQRHVESLLRDQSIGDPGRFSSLKQGDTAYFTQNVEVESVQQVDFLPLQNFPTLDRFYISRLKIANQFDVICVSLHIPRGWNVGEFDSPQKSGFLGILLARGKTPVFAASRLEWYPKTLLGNYGMDVALLDPVAPIPPTEITRENHFQLKLTDADCEPFYRLLTTVAKIPGQEIAQNIPAEKISVVELFNRPQFQQGRLVQWAGYARRIERINIDDPEITQRFGMDHYYQIAFFTEDSQGNPLFFCIPEIPAGMPLGEEEGFPVSLSISGFFYKTWAYRKIGDGGQAAESAKKPLTQLAPLLIGAKIHWFQAQEKPGKPSRSLAPLYSSSFVFLTLAFLWILLRRFRSRSQPLRFPLETERQSKP